MLSKIFNPRKEQEDQLRAMHRLPPGQAVTQKFPVLHYGPVPRVDLSTWNLRVFGEVEEEKVWTWQEFDQLPRTRVVLDLHCVTRWSKFDTLWEGVSVKALVEHDIIKPKPTAKFVIQHCEHSYATNTPLDLLLSSNMLMATHYDGKPLDPDHGWPLRMVVGVNAEQRDQTTAYLWKGGKWLRGLEFTRQDRLGFWERLGYNNEADPWQEQRYA